ncbi:hypothetical protein FA13DRAFT_1726009, partial [Coprinellus micaceus]
MSLTARLPAYLIRRGQFGLDSGDHLFMYQRWSLPRWASRQKANDAAQRLSRMLGSAFL